MALESVAIAPKSYRSHDLCIGDNVLAIRMDTDPIEFQPEKAQVGIINSMIQGLARAAKSVALHAEGQQNPEFHIQPVEDIANAIVLLSQLAEAIQAELEARQ